MRRAHQKDHEQEIAATDLAAEIRSLLDGGRTYASYLAGDWVSRMHGARSKLSIGLVNAGVERWPEDQRDDLFGRVTRAAAAWLQRRALLVPGTLISIEVIRETDLRLVSWSRGFPGRALWVGEAGALTTDPPPTAAEDAGE